MMQRRPTYNVYVEEGPGGGMAHVAELPGCFSTGSTASQAAAAAPGAITDFLLWLRSHREPLVPEAHVSRPSMGDIAVTAVLREGAPTAGGSSAALFEFDKLAWSDEKLERTLRWLSYSRADLLTAIENMPDAELQARFIAPDRTWYSTLRHLADAEHGCINCVAGPLEGQDAMAGTKSQSIREHLEAVREILQRQAREVPSERRASIILPTWAARPEEPWTLAKALRRALEHERQHGQEFLR